MKEDIAKLIKEILGIKPIIVDAENSKISPIIKEAIKKVCILCMIDEAESTAKDITSGDVKNLPIDVRNAGITLANVIMFDNEDARIVGVDNIKRLVKALDKSRTQFNYIAVKQCGRLNNMIADLQYGDKPCNGTGNDFEEDLTKLTKEELIARLREKSK
jgi:hypothetical protein